MSEQELPDGSFVSYTDYAQLERDLAEAREQSDQFCDKYLTALKRAEAAEARASLQPVEKGE